MNDFVISKQSRDPLSTGCKLQPDYMDFQFQRITTVKTL